MATVRIIYNFTTATHRSTCSSIAQIALGTVSYVSDITVSISVSIFYVLSDRCADDGPSNSPMNPHSRSPDHSSRNRAPSSHCWEGISDSCADNCPSYSPMNSHSRSPDHSSRNSVSSHSREGHYTRYINIWRRKTINMVTPPQVSLISQRHG